MTRWTVRKKEERKGLACDFHRLIVDERTAISIPDDENHGLPRSLTAPIWGGNGFRRPSPTPNDNNRVDSGVFTLE
jgi:hypothetical protein